MTGGQREQEPEIDWPAILATVKATVRRYSGGISSLGKLDVDQVISNVVLALLGRFRHPPFPEQPLAYAKTAAANCCKKLVDRKIAKGEPETTLLGELVSGLAVDDRLPRSKGNTPETEQVFRLLYATLTVRQARVLTDWLKDGCTKRVARDLGIKQQTVQSALALCEQKLRKIVENSLNPPVPPPS